MSKQEVVLDFNYERRIHVMAEGEEVFLGLNKNGVILGIILLIVCFPLCWIPFFVDACKAAK